MSKVCIIMTSYNKPKFIGKALQGILNQTYKDFELYLMDDNSNEETQKVIEPFLKDDRIKFFKSKVESISERVSKVRYAVLINKVLNEVNSKYITYATDDNVYRPNRLEKMVEFLDDNPNINVIYSSSITNFLDNEDNIVRSINRQAKEVTWCAPCILDHCSIMHRASILPIIKKRFESYWDENPQFYRIGDARFFWKINHFWPFHPINEILDDNYITETSIHHQLFSKEKSEFIKKLPKQRTCKELRSFLKNYRKEAK
ncbi:glycosyltransferase family 2 protein [Priestia megaterium]|uniref:glycosyltransferase family 2 protein n=1 Tax=Priestia megaterium TaxID=1404 RepID=UPI0028599FCE|nr:glycosyltransferase family 2 protein [Priestia megaterium]MDR7246586.1 glycosyltransferase involved in cell wall biosynthesis [Priestia megaterium]